MIKENYKNHLIQINDFQVGESSFEKNTIPGAGEHSSLIVIIENKSYDNLGASGDKKSSLEAAKRFIDDWLSLTDKEKADRIKKSKPGDDFPLADLKDLEFLEQQGLRRHENIGSITIEYDGVSVTESDDMDCFGHKTIKLVFQQENTHWICLSGEENL
ncbi:hypothetical protein [Armatimonas sp.]|uniref:hypothetical protein n=1 Tax=Armatimonas sp. TaxID=1872638 RepID=UPI00374D6FC5